jgi:hypothetical protein
MQQRTLPQRTCPRQRRGHARETSLLVEPMVGGQGKRTTRPIGSQCTHVSAATTSTGGQTSETQEGHGAGSRDDGEAETG